MTALLQRRRVLALIAAILFYPASAGLAADDDFIIVQSTTSTQNSGLFDHILPKFAEKTGVEVRVVAVGTTSVRALEAASAGGTIQPYNAETDIFILPGYEFQTVDLLLTNFHLPKSSLLMLVAAFAGRERVMAAYQHAIEQRYRFFSYGDAMLLVPHTR